MYRSPPYLARVPHPRAQGRPFPQGRPQGPHLGSELVALMLPQQLEAKRSVPRECLPLRPSNMNAPSWPRRRRRRPHLAFSVLFFRLSFVLV